MNLRRWWPWGRAGHLFHRFEPAGEAMQTAAEYGSLMHAFLRAGFNRTEAFTLTLETYFHALKDGDED